MTTHESSPSLILPARGGPPPSLTWRVWPVTEPTVAGLLGATLLIVCVVTAIVATTRRWDWAAFACVAVAVSAWRMFVPVTFEVSAMGITQHVFSQQRRLPWQTIRSVRFGVRGVRITATRGTGIAGLYVPFAKYRSELEALLEYYLPPRAIER